MLASGGLRSGLHIKRVLGYYKARYRGLEKNDERLHMLAAFTNLMVGKKYLLT